MSVQAHTIEDPPPSYTSQASAATLVDPSDPPIAAILKPSHSTCASRLAYATSIGRHSKMEYIELTFSIMVIANNLRAPIVISIDEDVETLIKDISRMFNNGLMLSTSRIKELRINWYSGSQDFGSGFHLSNGNVTAMLRLLKSRGGVDTIVAK
ncbi:hypothetical protein OEA41_004112 [Lepraria neglecta]|uniref:Uncharacterized protein n=1 Tax=Lepraria neglecta TaxID=209136 RepID=A0AAD9Z9L7_9LECA|nr:hypothetical protein OEA41_004112 [Lepraria neglecta]